MTDRLTGVEVLEALGQAGDPPLSAVGAVRTYFNTTTNRLRRSINGGAYADVPVVEETEYIPRLETNGSPNDTEFTANATLSGGSFILPRPVRLNRVVLRTVAFATPAEGVLLIYQEPQGRVVDSLALVATCSYTPAATTTHEVTPTEGEIVLSDGFFYALWGQVSGAGSYELQTYNTGAIVLATTTVPTGVHPLNANSALDPASPPATLDPMIGGDLTQGGTSDVVPVIRFRLV